MTRNKDISKRKLTKIDILVEFFIKPELPCNWSQKDWYRENFACKKLTQEFPDFDFFYTLTDIQNKFNSLLGLLGKVWKPKLQERYAQFIIDKNNKKIYDLSDKPLIDLETKKKEPKNILEFIRN